MSLTSPSVLIHGWAANDATGVAIKAADGIKQTGMVGPVGLRLHEHRV